MSQYDKIGLQGGESGLASRVVDETAIRSIATMLTGQVEALHRLVSQLEDRLLPILRTSDVETVPNNSPSYKTDFGAYLANIYCEQARLENRLNDLYSRVHLD